jgi:hypothetical protein
MSESGDLAPRSDVAALAARVRELEAQLIRTPVTLGRADADTDCTHCNTDCTHCPGDQFTNVLLPGEFERVSGGELVRRLRTSSGE